MCAKDIAGGVLWRAGGKGGPPTPACAPVLRLPLPQPVLCSSHPATLRLPADPPPACADCSPGRGAAQQGAGGRRAARAQAHRRAGAGLPAACRQGGLKHWAPAAPAGPWLVLSMAAPSPRAVRALSCFPEPVLLVDVASDDKWPIAWVNDRFARETGEAKSRGSLWLWQQIDRHQGATMCSRLSMSADRCHAALSPLCDFAGVPEHSCLRSSFWELFSAVSGGNSRARTAQGIRERQPFVLTVAGERHGGRLVHIGAGTHARQQLSMFRVISASGGDAASH